MKHYCLVEKVFPIDVVNVLVHDHLTANFSVSIIGKKVQALYDTDASHNCM